MLTEARRLVERFQTMIRKKANNDLDPWISDANPSLIASFARGVAKDKAAVLAAMDRQKGRSPSSSSLSARCLDAQSLTFFRPG
jgi:hypothetical protein